MGAIALHLILTTSPAAAEYPVRIVGGSSEETVEAADGTVRHTASGLIFPSKIGDMPARRIDVYGAGDVSVNYTLSGGGLDDPWIDFFVYRGLASIDEEANEVEQAIQQRWHGLTRAEAPAPLATLRDGRVAWFKAKADDRSFTTGFALVRRGEWFLKARFSIPDEAAAGTIERTVAALSALPWNWNPQDGSEVGKVAVVGR